MVRSCAPCDPQTGATVRTQTQGGTGGPRLDLSILTYSSVRHIGLAGGTAFRCCPPPSPVSPVGSSLRPLAPVDGSIRDRKSSPRTAVEVSP